MSLTLGNLWARNGVWSLDDDGRSDGRWLDSATRFPDVLAASLKLLVLFGAQAYTELYIASMQQHAQPALANDSGGLRLATVKLQGQDTENAQLIGARLVEALAILEGGVELLLHGGVRDKFDTRANPVLRRARDAVGCSAEAWSHAVTGLKARGIIVPVDQKGSYRLVFSDVAKGLLLKIGLQTRVAGGHCRRCKASVGGRRAS